MYSVGITDMVLQVSDIVTFLLAVPAPTTTPAEPSHVGEITIEDISDHTDTGTMEETEPISAVEPENEDGDRVRNTTCPVKDTHCPALNGFMLLVAYSLFSYENLIEFLTTKHRDGVRNTSSLGKTLAVWPSVVIYMYTINCI